MCGIAGMYNFKRGDLHEAYFSKCLDGMRHRGPDDKHIWNNGKNYLAGFVRLSIRDLSVQGRQPMFSACGKYCISFNGEIYNTEALQQLLQPFGITYHSTSDTEILLYALMHLGAAKTLAVADGIFAFAFYNLEQNILILARDRVGIKPLYMGVHDNGIVYSSQYDHIINHPYCKNNELDAGNIGAYLQLGYVPENAGAVRNTKLLLHGYYYTVTENGVNEHCYYNYGSNSAQGKNKNELEKIISSAAQSQLVSDVAVGTFMSGGTDSTLVTCYANAKQHIQSFTIGVKDVEMDEANAAERFSKIFQTVHQCRYIDERSFLELINDHFKAFSEPFADYSSLPTLMLSAFAKEKVTVALSGDGGDELFWGYPRNRKMLELMPLYSKSSVGRKVQLLVGKVTNPSKTDISRHWDMEDVLHYYYSSLFITGANQWVSKILQSESSNAFFYEQLRQTAGDDLDNTDNVMELTRKLEIDIHLQRILLKVDRASMYHSLEVRVPLLNNDMLDASENFSYTDCIINNQGKMPLKTLLATKADKELVFSKKKGFSIPIDAWLRNNLQKEVTEKIMDMPAHLSVLFNKKTLQQMLQQYMRGESNSGWLVWALYALVQWESTHRNSIAA